MSAAKRRASVRQRQNRHGTIAVHANDSGEVMQRAARPPLPVPRKLSAGLPATGATASPEQKQRDFEHSNGMNLRDFEPAVGSAVQPESIENASAQKITKFYTASESGSPRAEAGRDAVRTV